MGCSDLAKQTEMELEKKRSRILVKQIKVGVLLREPVQVTAVHIQAEGVIQTWKHNQKWNGLEKLSRILVKEAEVEAHFHKLVAQPGNNIQTQDRHDGFDPVCKFRQTFSEGTPG